MAPSRSMFMTRRTLSWGKQISRGLYDRSRERELQWCRNVEVLKSCGLLADRSGHRLDL